MRIAYVCTDQGIPVFGRKGCSIHVQEVIRSLIRHGAEIDLFTPRSEGSPPPDLQSVRLHPLPVAGEKLPAAREKAAFRANADLCHALKEEGPFDLVYERYALWSYAGMEYAQSVQVPGLLEINPRSSPDGLSIAFWSIATSRMGGAPRNWQRRGADRHLPGGRQIPGGVSEYRGSRSHHPQRRIPTAFATTSPALPLLRGRFTVGSSERKTLTSSQTLVQAFDRLSTIDPTVRLLIVGEGPQRSQLEADLSTRGLRDEVHFTGSVSPPDPRPAGLDGRRCRTLLVPGLFFFSPLKVYEYMAAGCTWWPAGSVK